MLRSVSSIPCNFCAVRRQPLCFRHLSSSRQASTGHLLSEINLTGRRSAFVGSRVIVASRPASSNKQQRIHMDNRSGSSLRHEPHSPLLRSPKALFLELSLGKRKASRHELLQVIHYIIELPFNAVTPKLVCSAFMIDIPTNMDPKVSQHFVGIVLDKLQMIPVGSMSSREVSGCLSGLRRFDPRVVPQVHQLVEALRPHLQTAILAPWSSRCVSFAFFGLNRLSENSAWVPETIRMLSTLLSTHSEIFPHRDIGNILYGFRNMRNKSVEVQHALECLLPHILRCSGVLDGRTLGTSLYGLRLMSTEAPVLANVVRAIVARTKESSDAYIDGQGIGNSLYGMQGMSDKEPEVLELIRLLSTKIESSNATMTSQEVSNAYFGLQSMTASTPEVQRLLELLLIKLKSCTKNFTAQGISNILFGLQGMRSDHHVVEETILNLVIKMRNMEDAFQSIGICSTLYGMRSFDSDSVAVRQLVATLTPQVALCSDPFTPRIVGTSIFGLQNLRCDHSETRDLLKVLAEKIRTCKAPLGAQNVGNALYGLRSMRSSDEAVRAVVEALIPLIRGCLEPLSAQELSNALYGLQNFTSQDSCVIELIKILGALVRESKAILTEQGVGNSLYGLQGMSSSISEIRDMVDALTPKVAMLNEPLSAQSASNALYGMQSMNNDNPEVEALLHILADKIESSAPFGGQAMGISLYGLHSMRRDTAGLRRILAVLSRKIDEMPIDVHIRSQELANALYGLQGLSNAISELRGVLISLLPKLRAVDIMSPHELAMSLFGMQGMDSESSIVRAVLVELTKQLQACSGPFDERDLTMAFFCVSGMNSSWKEVRDILDLLGQKLEACDCVDAQAMASILYSLQGIGADYESSERLLGIVVDKLRNCKGTITMQGIAMSLYGLKCMPEESRRVHELVDYIAMKLRKQADPIDGVFLGQFIYPLHALPERVGLQLISALIAKESISSVSPEAFSLSSTVPPGSMTPSSLSCMLYGMQRLDGADSRVAELHRFAAEQLSCVLAKRRNLNDRDYSPHQMQMLQHNVKIFLWFSKNLNDKMRFEFESHYSKLDRMLNEVSWEEFGTSSFRSETERKVHAALVAVFKNKQNMSKDQNIPELTFNRILHSFEADAILRFDGHGHVDPIVLNVEVDGPRHRHGNVRSFTERRDEVLAGAHGIIVARLNEVLLANIDEASIVNRIVESLKSGQSSFNERKSQMGSVDIEAHQKRVLAVISLLEQWRKI